MCLAPRYINGPIALPSRPCRNTASLPDTPCASRPTDPSPTSSASAASPIIRFLLLIAFMACITRFVDRRSGRKDAVGALGLRGLDCLGAGRDKRLRHLHPVAVVHRSEERRVGKECRSRWWPYHDKKKGC